MQLAPRTTLRLGGPAGRLVEAASEEELVALVAEADAAGEEPLVLAGGSNVVVADAGFLPTVRISEGRMGVPLNALLKKVYRRRMAQHMRAYSFVLQ